MQIKMMPKDERPMEKTFSKGIGSLTNSELIALVIKSGTKKKSAIVLAQEILTIEAKGLSFLAECELHDLMKIDGIGLSRACSILACVELGKRISSCKKNQDATVDSAKAAASIFMETLRYEKKEHFNAVLLNSKGKIISTENISIGELSSTIVHPREVFIPAIKKSAAAIIFVHNHPSGDCTPSGEDVDTTARLIECGELLGIKVLDHIIIGDGEFSSLKMLDLI